MSRTIAVLLLVLSSAARAGAPAVDPRAVEARQACAAGHVEQGIALLARIVGETGDPNAVYNQARCYEQNGRIDQALTRFREYLLTTKDLTARERAEVEAHVRELEAAVRASGAKSSTPAVLTPPAAMASPPADPSPTPVPAAMPAPAGRSRPARIAAVALAATGVASLAGGAFFGWQAKQTQSEIENQRGVVPNGIYQDRLSHGRRAETLEWVGYGLGAAALVSSAAVYLLSRPRAAEPVTVAVLASPGLAGLSVQGHY